MSGVGGRRRIKDESKEMEPRKHPAIDWKARGLFKIAEERSPDKSIGLTELPLMIQWLVIQLSERNIILCLNQMSY